MMVKREFRHIAWVLGATALAWQPHPAHAAPRAGRGNATTIDFALLGPDFARNISDRAVTGPIVARARKYLKRKPAPLREIHIEGVSSGQVKIAGVTPAISSVRPDIAASWASLRDMDVMLDLALAWRITGDRKFLRATERYLTAWTSTYRLTFNPIDEGRFDGLILAYDLVEDGLTPGERRGVDDFLRQMATGYIVAMETGNVAIKPTLTNNWQSHRLKLATLAAFQIGDAELVDRAHVRFDMQLSANLRADGSTLDFAQRDALHYVTFSLDSLSLAALAAKVHGQNWYDTQTSDGKSLSKTLDWVSQFASGKTRHVEFVKSFVPYDRQRAAAGGQAFQNKPWDPVLSARLYLIARHLDPRWRPLSTALLAGSDGAPVAEKEPGDRFDWLLLMKSDRP